MLRLFLLFNNLRSLMNWRAIIWESCCNLRCCIWRWLIKEHWECAHFFWIILRLVKHVSDLSFLSWWSQEIYYISLLLMPLAMMMMFFRVFILRTTIVSVTLLLIRIRILRCKDSMRGKPILLFITKLRCLFLIQLFIRIYILIIIIQVFFNLVETILS